MHAALTSSAMQRQQPKNPNCSPFSTLRALRSALAALGLDSHELMRLAWIAGIHECHQDGAELLEVDRFGHIA